MNLEDIALIPQLIEQNAILIKQNTLLNERLNKLHPPITTKKEVAKCLNNVSTRTINTYMKDGLLKEGYHYYRKGGKMLVFIEDAVLQLRDEMSKGVA